MMIPVGKGGASTWGHPLLHHSGDFEFHQWLLRQITGKRLGKGHPVKETPSFLTGGGGGSSGKAGGEGKRGPAVEQYPFLLPSPQQDSDGGGGGDGKK